MLGEGLKGNVMLEVLLLSGNDRIGEDGARHLMVALAANRSLQFLGLSGSNMTGGVAGQKREWWDWDVVYKQDCRDKVAHTY